MLRVKQGGIKNHFWVFIMTWLGNESRSPGPLTNINCEQTNVYYSKEMIIWNHIIISIRLEYFILYDGGQKKKP